MPALLLFYKKAQCAGFTINVLNIKIIIQSWEKIATTAPYVAALARLILAEYQATLCAFRQLRGKI